MTVGGSRGLELATSSELLQVARSIRQTSHGPSCLGQLHLLLKVDFRYRLSRAIFRPQSLHNPTYYSKGNGEGPRQSQVSLHYKALVYILLTSFCIMKRFARRVLLEGPLCGPSCLGQLHLLLWQRLSKAIFRPQSLHNPIYHSKGHGEGPRQSVQAKRIGRGGR
jgi:hypothetical protein